MSAVARRRLKDLERPFNETITAAVWLQAPPLTYRQFYLWWIRGAIHVITVIMMQPKLLPMLPVLNDILLLSRGLNALIVIYFVLQLQLMIVFTINLSWSFIFLIDQLVVLSIKCQKIVKNACFKVLISHGNISKDGNIVFNIIYNTEKFQSLLSGDCLNDATLQMYWMYSYLESQAMLCHLSAVFNFSIAPFIQ